jgi:hypothetical protein
MLIKIRFNTDTIKDPGSKLPFWRVIYEGQEHLAWNIKISAPSWTTCDDIGEGVQKWHITTNGRIAWDSEKKNLEILPE